MQQTFHTRNYSVRDFEEWDQRGELLLQPRFQRHVEAEFDSPHFVHGILF